MSIESATGVVTPSRDDTFKPTTDLGGMATSLDVIHNRRANHWIGTAANRVAQRNSIAEGSFWSDTTGSKAVWLKQGSAWVQIYPAPPTGVLRLGGYDRNYDPVFVNLRNLWPSGKTSATTLQNGENQVMLSGWKDGSNKVMFRLFHTGRFSITSGGVTRRQPFGITSGTAQFENNTPNTPMTRSVSFPAGMFTATPFISLSVHTALPHQCSVGFSSLTKDGMTIYFTRTSAATANVHWTAIQY